MTLVELENGLQKEQEVARYLTNLASKLFNQFPNEEIEKKEEKENDIIRDQKRNARLSSSR